METKMLKLTSPYKPLNKAPEQLKLEESNKPLALEKQQDFKTQFMNVRQSYQRTEQQKMQALREQCMNMEAELVKIMVNQMYKTINKTDFIHGGQAEEMFRDMLNEQYAESIVKNTNLGIGESIYRQIMGLYR
ncbi:MAG TPA: rod-binding protein [bacterium]|nr:rod-binding protein [bacterium]HPP86415.1 rod-binding protein [bacterium]